MLIAAPGLERNLRQGVEFDATDYWAPTPEWALYGSEEAEKDKSDSSSKLHYAVTYSSCRLFGFGLLSFWSVNCCSGGI